MDISGQNSLVLLYDVNPDTNLTTITFKDVTEAVTLGTLVIENNRHRTFIEALAEIAKVYHTDYDTTLQGSKTNLSKNSNRATLDFG